MSIEVQNLNSKIYRTSPPGPLKLSILPNTQLEYCQFEYYFKKYSTSLDVRFFFSKNKGLVLLNFLVQNLFFCGDVWIFGCAVFELKRGVSHKRQLTKKGEIAIAIQSICRSDVWSLQ